jgi:ubiquinone/menaquinone biosynthesis C-methylase UbiE
MSQTEFDHFARSYEDLHAKGLATSGEGPDYFAEYKVRDVVKHLANNNKTVKGLLDFGCGVGSSIPYIRRHLPTTRITGVDVSQKSLEVAQHRFSGEAEFCWFDGSRLSFNDNAFDVVFTACVFHHIPAVEHHRLLCELRRVLAPGGVFFVFEHNPLNPLTRRVVNACPFDENAVLMKVSELKQRLVAAQFKSIRQRYRIFFPRALRLLRWLEGSLSWCPLGAQYYLCAEKC